MTRYLCNVTILAKQHPIFMSLFHLSAYATDFPTELQLCMKTSVTVKLPLLCPSISPHRTGLSVLCGFHAHMGGVLLKVGQTAPHLSDRTHTVLEHRWFWTPARHSSVSFGEVALATGLLRMSDSGRSGLLVFSCWCCGYYCSSFRQILCWREWDPSRFILSASSHGPSCDLLISPTIKYDNCLFKWGLTRNSHMILFCSDSP